MGDHSTLSAWLVGVFIIAVWGGAQLLEQRAQATRSTAIAGVVTLLVLLSLMPQLQVKTWRNARSVVEHTIATSPSSVMYYNLGNIFVSGGDYEVAVRYSDAPLTALRGVAMSLSQLGRQQATAEIWRPVRALKAKAE